MIRLPKFDLVVPSSLDDALVCLSQANDETKIIAGGTDLLVALKQELFKPTRVVSLAKLQELHGISFSEQDGLHIGAMCSLNDIGTNEVVNKRFPALGQAVHSIASPQIRNRATIGGNLCLNTRCEYYDQSAFWRSSLGFCLKCGNGVCRAAPELDHCTAVCCSDLAPLLIALDAKILLKSVDSHRTISLSQLYSNDGAYPLTIKSSEVLTQIDIPYSQHIKSAHAKIRRRGSIDFPLLNIGVAITMAELQHCTRAQIVIGAIASKPLVIEEASKYLRHCDLTKEHIAKVSEIVGDTIHPMPNVYAGVLYRKKLVRFLTEHTLLNLLHLQ